MQRIRVVCLLGIGLALGTGPALASESIGPKANKSPQRVPAVRTDRFGDPLPEGAVARLGTVRWRLDGDLADAMAVSRDGKALVTANALSGITLWDMATGRILRRVPGKMDQRRRWLGNDRMMALSSDAGTAVFVNKDQVLFVVDVGKGNQRRQWELGSRVERIVVSADGGVVATRIDDGLIQVWDARSGKELYRVTSSPKKFDRRHARWLALSGDGKTLAYVGDDKGWPIHVHDLVKGKERQCIKGHDGSSRQIVLSADGARLVSLSRLGLVQVWELKRGRRFHRWQGKEGYGFPMAHFSPDGRNMVLTGNFEGDFDGPRLLDLRSGKVLWKVKGTFVADNHDNYVFTPDGKTLIVTLSIEQAIQRYDAASGQRILAPHEPCYDFSSVAFSADAKRVHSITTDEMLRTWDAGSWRELRRTPTGTTWGTFSPDGRVVGFVKDGTLVLHDICSGSKRRTELTNPALEIGGLVFSPDGTALAIFGANSKNRAKNLIQLWDVASMKERRRVVCEEAVIQVAFTSRGESLGWLCGDNLSEHDRVLRFMDLTTGRKRSTIRQHPASLNNLLLSPDDKTLIISGQETTLELIELATAKRRAVIEPCNVAYAPMSYSPDRKFIFFVNTESYLQIHDAFTGERLANVHGHRGTINSLVMSPDGRRFATISNDTTVLVWDTEAVLRKVRKPPVKLTGQELEQLWADLAGDDAIKAYRAIGQLARAPEQTVAWVKEHLRPAKAVDGKRLKRLLAYLDRKEFRVRDQASREIERMGDLAHPALEKVLAGNPPLEVRKRVERLMEKYALPQSAAARQAVRAVELLAHINNREAGRVLEGLARGAPGALVTREAKAAVERQARRVAIKQ